MAMEDWSLDVINDYCQEHFKGSFVCEVFEGKGRIMIAKKAVKQGELLFSELPLHIVQEDESNQAFEAVKHLCEEDEQDEEFSYEPLWYWTALCSLTKEQLKDGPTIGSLKAVTPEQQRRLLCLYHEPVEEASYAVQCIVSELGLSVAPLLVEELLQAWILNCFEHSEDPLGYSAYFASSFVSHSCGPNAAWTEAENGAHVLHAREDIAIGDEVTISYLEEHALLHSAEDRKRVLQETKLFECACERCAPPADGSLGADVCRGFLCRKCGKCAIFHPLRRDRKGKGKGKAKGKGKGAALNGVACSACGAIVDIDESKRLLKAEADLEAKLNLLDEQVEKSDGDISKLMNAAKAQGLLKLVANGESGPVGPQHWLCDRVWTHVQCWYASQNRRADKRRMLELRVEYRRKAYDGLSAALAWTLEQQADTLLKHLGFGMPMLQSDKEFEDDMVAQVLPVFEESMLILGLMFGTDHEHYTSVERKHKIAQKFFEKRATKS